jgi:RHS repeat-associated protein
MGRRIEKSSTTATSVFDNNGNTLTKTVGSDTTTYTWDFENRLTSVTLPGSGGTVTFKYDPLGRRIEKSSTATTSVFAYDGDNLIEEANSSGAVVARYTQTQNIDEPLAMLRSSTTSYYEADGLGSNTSLSNGSCSLAENYTFDSFGKQTASSGLLTNPFQYTCRTLDFETGLYYYRARYYDPSNGKFLSEDPDQFDGGVNFYAYVDNGPADWTDSDGTGRDRGTTGQPGGTPNPFKHMKPDPNNPNQVIYDDPHSGKSYPKAKPPGFDGGLNGSMQHLHRVLLMESTGLILFAGASSNKTKALFRF